MNASQLHRLGLAMYSCSVHWRAAREQTPGARFHDALTFLEYARSLGAAGVQVGVGTPEPAETKRLRTLVDSTGLYLEGICTLPRDSTGIERFEAEVSAAKDAGAVVIRTAMLSGRRYETFATAAAFREFAGQARESLALSEPIVKRHGVRLAVENHKDWLVEELVEIIRRLGSQHVGICVDTGNSIALLEDAMSVVQAYAPFAASVHLKDMAVAAYDDGFLLSEVPLGQGILDLPGMIATLRKANPSVRFNLEMITRDPLRVPCLSDGYWPTLEGVLARRLARALATVRHHPPRTPLPTVQGLSTNDVLKLEERFNVSSLEHAHAALGL